MFGSYHDAISVLKNLAIQQLEYADAMRKAGKIKAANHYEDFALMTGVCIEEIEAAWRHEEAEFSQWYQKNLDGIDPDEAPFDTHAMYLKSKFYKDTVQ